MGISIHDPDPLLNGYGVTGGTLDITCEGHIVNPPFCYFYLIRLHVCEICIDTYRMT